MTNDDDRDETLKSFGQAANMTPGRLETWLKSVKSKAVGRADGKNKKSRGGKEAIGHVSSRKITAIKRKKKADLIYATIKAPAPSHLIPRARDGAAEAEKRQRFYKQKRDPESQDACQSLARLFEACFGLHASES